MGAHTAALNVCLLTPNGVFFEGTAEMVIIRTTEGDLGVLPGHIPLTALIGEKGRLTVLSGGARNEYAVSCGFAEILPGSVTVAAERAEPASVAG